MQLRALPGVLTVRPSQQGTVAVQLVLVNRRAQRAERVEPRHMLSDCQIAAHASKFGVLFRDVAGWAQAAIALKQMPVDEPVAQ